MQNPVFMREYLHRVGVDLSALIDQKAIEQAYFRHIYCVDSRKRVLNTKGVPVKKASYPRFLNGSRH